MVENNNNPGLWDIIKTIGNWAWVPFGAYLSYRQQRNNRNEVEKESMDDRIDDLEQQTHVHTIQIDSLKEMIRDVKSDIKEIREGINRLVEKLI